MIKNGLRAFKRWWLETTYTTDEDCYARQEEKRQKAKVKYGLIDSWERKERP